MKPFIYLIFQTLLLACLNGCSLLPSPSDPPHQLWIDPKPERASAALPGRAKRVWVWIAPAEADSLLKTKRLWLRPTSHTLGAYADVSWATPPLKLLKKSLIYALQSTHQLKGVTDTFQEAVGSTVKVSFHVDTLWIDHTLEEMPYARIRGTWTLSPKTPGACANHQAPFDVRAPIPKLNQQETFKALEQAVHQWAHEGARWVLKNIP